MRPSRTMSSIRPINKARFLFITVSLLQTFEFEGVPGHVLMETTRFEEHNGKTLLTAISVYQSLEDRDGMVAAGMESGA